MKKQDKDITLAKKRFQRAVDAESKNRKRAVASLRFIALGEQWDASTKAEREKDGRPCMVINKVQSSTRQIINDARQAKPAIKARPVDDTQDPQLTDIINGLIKRIETNSDAKSAYANGIENAVNAGWGYWRVLIETSDYDVWEKDLCIKRIVNPFSVYDDPGAREADRRDRKWLFITDTMPRDEFETQYPKVKLEGWESGEGETGEDWVGEDTVRIAEYYYMKKVKKTLALIATLVQNETGEETLQKDTIELTPDIEIVEYGGERIIETEQGKAVIQRTRETEVDEVWWCKIGGNTYLETPVKQSGRYIPVVYCAGDETWIEGEPVIKSAGYHAFDAARMYNWARSNSVETLALAPKQPFIGTPAMFDGHEAQWDEANRKPKMRLLANFDDGQLPRRQEFSIRDTGALAEGMQAADDVKATMGLFDASLGASGNETSGRAITARQKQGDNANFHFHDNQFRAIRFTGVILLDLIPIVFDTERVVRYTNKDDTLAWASINKTILDPKSPTGTRVLNDLSIAKYDIVMDTGQEYMTKRMEMADMMSQFLAQTPDAAPVLLPRIAKALDWNDSDKIGAELQQLFSPPPPEADPVKELEIEGKRLDVESKALDVEKAKVELENSKIKSTENTSETIQKAVLDVLYKLGMLPERDLSGF